jgi:hypothetical protein
LGLIAIKPEPNSETTRTSNISGSEAEHSYDPTSYYYLMQVITGVIIRRHFSTASRIGPIIDPSPALNPY